MATSDLRDLILSIDQGTTGTTVLVVDNALVVRGRGYRELPQIFPRPGEVEHDPEEIWRTVVEAIGEAIAHAEADASQIAAIGITNQRETTIVWERASGRSIGNAIVWQDRRTAPSCAALKEAGQESRIRQLTGLVLDPYFSATKLKWMLDEDAGLRRRAKKGDLAFGTVDSFLVWRLSGGGTHVSDVSNASRTLLFDIERLGFSDELCDLFDVPRAMLPEVCPCAAPIAKTRGVPGLPDGIPIAGMAGDQQSALFGQDCLTAGDAKCTYGTGAFILMNVGERPVRSKNGLLSTVAWTIEGKTSYALEGSAFIAGALVQWLRDGLGIIERAADVEALAASVTDNGGVTIVPALAGLGAPHWRPEARGIISGITRGTTRGHIARAALEAIALQNADLVSAMQMDAGQPVNHLRVDGGAAQNDLLMQIQSDLLGTTIYRPQMVETTALGAAKLAARGAGMELMEKTPTAKVGMFRPTMDAGGRKAQLDRWHAAVARA